MVYTRVLGPRPLMAGVRLAMKRKVMPICRTIKSLGLLITMLLLSACYHSPPKPLYHRGWFGGKTDSIPKGTGNLNGNLEIKEPYILGTANVYIKANGKKYYGSIEPSGHFVIESVPCGKWPIVLNISYISQGTKRNETYESTICITSQGTGVDFFYLEPQPFF